TGKAPLRETLAAALVLDSGWDGSSPLLDPFCGAGTIVIEAALLAAGIPPGIKRRFAFMDWPAFDPALWEEIAGAAGPPRIKGQAPILASDRDEGAVQAARENAERAGVGGRIDFSCRAVSAIEPPARPGYILTNPPYGVRLGPEEKLKRLYAQLGNIARRKCPGWRVSFFSTSPVLSRSTGLSVAPGIQTRNGGIRVRIVKGRVA
ncbi:MAG TPA: class I SAM-dependent RNA methyltransferase, partial [Thermodesulfobacteriota bacterium]|nr:class I SAM-dependent RNA methyltransferase [Thermodesulfobacteriota bacterium]